MSVEFDVRGQQGMDFSTGGSVIMDIMNAHFGQKWPFKVKHLYGFYLIFWTLILTAPIHCRGSIGEQVMQWYIFPNMFKRWNKLIYT